MPLFLLTGVLHVAPCQAEASTEQALLGLNGLGWSREDSNIVIGFQWQG